MVSELDVSPGLVIESLDGIGRPGTSSSRGHRCWRAHPERELRTGSTKLPLVARMAAIFTPAETAAAHYGYYPMATQLRLVDKDFLASYQAPPLVEPPERKRQIRRRTPPTLNVGDVVLAVVAGVRITDL